MHQNQPERNSKEQSLLMKKIYEDFKIKGLVDNNNLSATACYASLLTIWFRLTSSSFEEIESYLREKVNVF